MEITRRRLFASFFSIVPLSAGRLTDGRQRGVDAPDQFQYKGYKVRWTGWKQSQENDLLFGQWVACDILKNKMFYASSGGIGDQYRRGDLLNISILSPDHFVNLFTDEQKKKDLRKETLDYLIRLINTQG